MSTPQLLSGITLLDCTQRLPGPWAMHALALLGARVIKIEDEQFKDPFVHSEHASQDVTFGRWYAGMNQHKTLVRLPLKKTSGRAQLHRYLNQAQGLLLDWPLSLRERLGLTPAGLPSDGPLQAIVEAQALVPMHDLNVLAETALLGWHLKDREDPWIAPPFLPLAGLLYGQQLALHLLASLHAFQQTQERQWTVCPLLEVSKPLLAPLLAPPQANQALHNGAFPCYALYRLRDGQYVALAAVEKKFWHIFDQALNTGLRPEERFARGPQYFDRVASALGRFSWEELQERVDGESCCLNLVR